MATQNVYKNAAAANAGQYEGITFGVFPRTGTITGTIAEVWDTEDAKPSGAENAEERMEAFKKLAAKYPHTLDVRQMILNDPIDTWEATLNKYAETANISRALNSSYALINQELHRRKRGANSYNEEQVGIVLNTLDIDATFTAFTAAAERLGDTVLDVNKAIARDAEALSELRTHGQKLMVLTRLATMMDFNDVDRQRRWAALFAEVDSLPNLTGYRISRGRWVHLHTTEDAQAHDDLEKSLYLAKENTEAFLTLLALGKIPHLKFKVIADAEEWRQRIAHLETVGVTQEVPAPKTEKQRVNISAGLAGTTVTPAK